MLGGKLEVATSQSAPSIEEIVSHKKAQDSQKRYPYCTPDSVNFVPFCGK